MQPVQHAQPTKEVHAPPTTKEVEVQATMGVTTTGAPPASAPIEGVHHYVESDEDSAPKPTLETSEVGYTPPTRVEVVQASHYALPPWMTLAKVKKLIGLASQSDPPINRSRGNTREIRSPRSSRGNIGGIFDGYVVQPYLLQRL